MDKSVEIALYFLVLMFALGGVFFVWYSWSLISEKKDKKF